MKIKFDPTLYTPSYYSYINPIEITKLEKKNKIGGDYMYKAKFLKYKAKYLNLKYKLNN